MSKEIIVDDYFMVCEVLVPCLDGEYEMSEEDVGQELSEGERVCRGYNFFDGNDQG